MGGRAMKLKKNLLKLGSASALLSLLLSANVWASDGMQVHFLNVGQADSTLITCGDHAMLIDAGNDDDDVPVLNYIQNKQGISHLDYIICTHPHEDHIGAMDAVINTVDVHEVLMPDVTTTTQTFDDLLTAIDSNGLSITVPEVGQTYTLGDASFTILAPVNDYGDDLNNWSIGLKLTCGDSDFVFTGDAEANAEGDILATGIDLDAEVFQAGHHGSSTSNSDALLSAISPDYVVISCGEGNSYGHPNAETIDRFQNYGIQIFRTDKQGTVVASTDGSTITWSTDPTTDYSSGDGISSNNDDASYYKETEVPAEEPIYTGVTVHITETGSKYHSAGCQYLSKSDIEVSLSEAKAMVLEACSRCNPPA